MAQQFSLGGYPPNTSDPTKPKKPALKFVYPVEIEADPIPSKQPGQAVTDDLLANEQQQSQPAPQRPTLKFEMPAQEQVIEPPKPSLVEQVRDAQAAKGVEVARLPLRARVQGEMRAAGVQVPVSSQQKPVKRRLPSSALPKLTSPTAEPDYGGEFVAPRPGTTSDQSRSIGAPLQSKSVVLPKEAPQTREALLQGFSRAFAKENNWATPEQVRAVIDDLYNLQDFTPEVFQRGWYPQTGRYEIPMTIKPELADAVKAYQTGGRDAARQVVLAAETERQRRRGDLAQVADRQLSAQKLGEQAGPGGGVTGGLKAVGYGALGMGVDAAAGLAGLPQQLASALQGKEYSPADEPEFVQNLRELGAYAGGAANAEVSGAPLFNWRDPRTYTAAARRLAGPAGSMLPFLAGGAAAGGGKAAMAIIGAMGAGSQSAQGFQDALGEGASPEQIRDSSLLNALLGTFEAAGGEAQAIAKLKGKWPGLRQLGREVAGEMPQEALQEGGTQFGSNVIARDLVGYDPQRDRFEGVREAATVGAVLGGLTSGSLGAAKLLMERMPGRGNQPVQPAEIEQAVQLFQQAGVDPEQLLQAPEKLQADALNALQAQMRFASQRQQVQAQLENDRAMAQRGEARRMMGHVPTVFEQQAMGRVAEAEAINAQLDQREQLNNDQLAQISAQLKFESQKKAAEEAAKSTMGADSLPSSERDRTADRQPSVNEAGTAATAQNVARPPLRFNLLEALQREQQKAKQQALQFVPDEMMPAGAPTDAQPTDLVKAVRKEGGLGADSDVAGELRRLGVKESGTTGIFNPNTGLPVDEVRLRMKSEGLTQAETVDDFVTELDDAIARREETPEERQLLWQKLNDAGGEGVANSFFIDLGRTGGRADYGRRQLDAGLEARPDSEPAQSGAAARASQPAPEQLEKQPSQYQRLVNDNRAAVNQLYGGLDLTSPEAQQLVGQLRDYAKANQIAGIHVARMLDDVRNHQMRQASEADRAGVRKVTKPEQLPDDVEMEAPEDWFDASDPSAWPELHRVTTEAERDAMFGRMHPAKLEDALRALEDRRNAYIKGTIQLDPIERAQLFDDLSSAREERKARVKRGEMKARDKAPTKEERAATKARRIAQAQAAGQRRKEREARSPLGRDVSTLTDAQLTKLVADAQRIENSLADEKSYQGSQWQKQRLHAARRWRGELERREANPQAAVIDQAAHEAATSPQNDRPEPTDAQKEAGNYKKGHVNIHGLDVTIENPRGSKRSGKGPDGKPWEVEMTAHYGYIKRTEGADGEQVDVYIGDRPASDRVFVVDQVDAKTKVFDEHKVILGVGTLAQAQYLYDAHFDDGKGPQRRGAVTEMGIDEFKDWLKNEDNTKPLAYNPAPKEKANVSVQSNQAQSGSPHDEASSTDGIRIAGESGNGERPGNNVFRSIAGVGDVLLGRDGLRSAVSAADASTASTSEQRTDDDQTGGVARAGDDASGTVSIPQQGVAVLGGVQKPSTKPETGVESAPVKEQTDAERVRETSGSPTANESNSLPTAEGDGAIAQGNQPDGEARSKSVRASDRGRGGLPERPSIGTRSTRREAATDRGGESGAESRSDREREPGNREDAANAGRAEDQQPASANRAPDYVIADDANITPGGTETKLKANLAALRLVHQLRAEGRTPSVEEQHTLAAYTGWGQFPDVFNEYNDGGKKRAVVREELKALLGAEGYERARASTLNAHYTAPQITRAMWRMAERLGFKGGRVVEPSVGTGNFLGVMPQGLRAVSKLTGVELDPTTAAIAQYLYPSANIQARGYETLKTPDGFFDFAIGNVPFGDYKLNDARYNKHNARIHDYFFLKSVDQVRPGGLVMFITSTGTMDKLDGGIREALAAKADLVAAMRLPGQTFKQNAGTDVVTDIIILWRRVDGEESNGVAWTGTKEVADPAGGKAIPVNEYFADHPEMILGTLDRKGSMYRGDSVNVSRTDDFEERFERAIEALPQNVWSERQTQTNEFAAAPVDRRTREGSTVIDKGQVYRVESGQLVPRKLTAKQAERVQLMQGLRDAGQAVLDVQRDSTGDVEVLRRTLKSRWESYTSKHGFLHERGNATLLAEDPDGPLILALEDWNPKTKTATVAPLAITPAPKIVEPKTAGDAVALSLFERGRLDLDLMAERLGQTVEEVGQDLVESGLAYHDPGAGWVTAAQYLSGNVRRKLWQAREAAAADPTFAPNIKALEKVQPADVDYGDIHVKLGAPWVPPSDVSAFITELLEADESAVSVGYLRASGRWFFDFAENATGRRAQMSEAARTLFATKRASFKQVVQSALTDVAIRIEDVIDSKTVMFNAEESAAANQKVKEIRARFAEWVWEDDARRVRLHRYYNDNFNNLVPMKYDAAHYKDGEGKIRLPGMNPGLDLRPAQANGIYRAVVSGKGIFGYEVGVGKTMTMLGAAMELKRLGLAKKTVLAVPKAVLPGFAAEARLMYPGAKILTTEGSFDADKRKRTIARIATGDWDMVIMTHDHLGFLSVRPEREAAFVEEQIKELVAAVEEAKISAKNDKGNRLVKELEKLREKLEFRFNEIVENKKRDDAVYFEDLGVDALFVDEFHTFKSLPIYTQLRGIKGIPQATSDRAMDMLLKFRYISELTGGRNIFGATGTPVTNTVAEVYNLQRYFQPEVLKERGVEAFDGWAKTFGDFSHRVERTADGQYQPVTRFNQFSNLPELVQMTREMMDVVFASDVAEIKRPVRKEEVMRAEMAPEQSSFLYELQARAKAIRSGQVKPWEDNMLAVAGDARKSALDHRLIDPSFVPESPTKIDQVVNNALTVHRQQPGKTQMIFCDLGVNPGKSSNFTVYQEVINRLVAGGISRDKIINFSDLTDTQRRGAAARLQEGDALIGIGGSTTMGTGVNAQRHLAALHHLDVPWLPAYLEQRDGRGVRQGNTNSNIKIYRYVTEGSFDSFMWQTVDAKSKFIRAFMKGDANARTIREADDETFSEAQIMAIASGNPRLLEKVQLDDDIAVLEQAERSFNKQRFAVRDSLMRLKEDIPRNEATAAKIAADAEFLKTQEKGGWTVGGKEFETAEERGKALDEALANAGFVNAETVAQYKGFDLSYDRINNRAYVVRDGRYEINLKLGEPSSTMASAMAVLRGLPKRAQDLRDKIAQMRKDQAKLEAQTGAEFNQRPELEEKRERRNRLVEEMKAEGKPVEAQPEAEAPAASRGNVPRGTDYRAAMAKLEDLRNAKSIDNAAMGTKKRTREDVENSPEFKRWFGKSKVVDGDGKPLKVYHGTGNEFESFIVDLNRDKSGQSTNLFGDGVYLTESPMIASEYALLPKSRQSAVIPLYARIERPLDLDRPMPVESVYALAKLLVDDYGENGTAQTLRKVETSSSYIFQSATQLIKFAMSGPIINGEGVAARLGPNDWRSLFKRLGYDGLTHMGGRRIGLKMGLPEHRVWVALDAEQVKSAVGNTTFDPENPSIVASRGNRPRLAEATPEQVIEHSVLVVRPPTGTRPARLYANDLAMAVLRQALNIVYGQDYGNARAFNATAPQLREVAGALREMGAEVGGAAETKLMELAKVLQDATRNYSKQGAFSIVDASSLTSARAVGLAGLTEGQDFRSDVREEQFHWAQREISGDSVALTGKNWAERRLPARYRKELLKRGYPANDEILAAEAAAQIAAGNFEGLGLRTDAAIDVAFEWLGRYFERVAKVHGLAALDQFRHLPARAKEAREKGRNERQRKEAEKAGSRERGAGSAADAGVAAGSRPSAGARGEPAGRDSQAGGAGGRGGELQPNEATQPDRNAATVRGADETETGEDFNVGAMPRQQPGLLPNEPRPEATDFSAGPMARRQDSLLPRKERPEAADFSAGSMPNKQEAMPFLSPTPPKGSASISDAEVARWRRETKSTLTALKQSGKLNPKLGARVEPILERAEKAIRENDGVELVRQRQEMVDALHSNATLRSRLLDLLNIPRVLKTTFDLSYPLRQGVIGNLNLRNLMPGGRLSDRGSEWKNMFKSLKKSNFEQFQSELRNHPLYDLAEQCGLYLVTRDSQEVGAGVFKREESFTSTLASKIPGIPASERAFTGIADLQRIQIFQSFVQELERAGVSFEGDAQSYKDVASFVNNMTGRGDLPKFLDSLSPVLSTVMFSPRFLASRIKILNPTYYASLSKPARKIALKEMAGFFGMVGLIGAGALAMGATVGFDPDDSDFLKIRVGNTRFDLLAGMQQWGVFVFRMLKLAKGNALNDPEDRSIGDVVEKFARSKMSPGFSYFYDWLIKAHPYDKGGWNKKKPFSHTEAGKELFIPIMFKDFYEAFQKEGMIGVGKTVPGLFGVSVSTYQKMPRLKFEFKPEVDAELKRLGVEPEPPKPTDGESEADYQKLLKGREAKVAAAVKRFDDDAQTEKVPASIAKLVLKYELQTPQIERYDKLSAEGQTTDRAKRIAVEQGIAEMETNPVFKQMAPYQQEMARDKYRATFNKYGFGAKTASVSSEGRVTPERLATVPTADQLKQVQEGVLDLWKKGKLKRAE